MACLAVSRRVYQLLPGEEHMIYIQRRYMLVHPIPCGSLLMLIAICSKTELKSFFCNQAYYLIRVGFQFFQYLVGETRVPADTSEHWFLLGIRRETWLL
ncbi:hypothetical protein KSX_68520 [Ktedonospora formicarum]|uniref:Uncharacterized protein n=1 Tax=Ktedonospora formicarum TaxID=2778364 RepID=A0A8J3I3L6_9CHLR|nr:hypothetical protein KSX_68520 [Ktedonospora formicarum]